MQRLIIIGAGLVVAAVPTVLGVAGNTSLTASVPLKPAAAVSARFVAPVAAAPTTSPTPRHEHAETGDDRATDRRHSGTDDHRRRGDDHAGRHDSRHEGRRHHGDRHDDNGHGRHHGGASDDDHRGGHHGSDDHSSDD
jgi:hypothetical protein